ncbi:MAG: sodium-extruding oxaloacetate decarboxylase subunit alpha [Planctomycetes bacterium]|nr:sodium-extruding oxaloacetate decarboxylase subunit alpha [Planctomycetota bacterium]
MVKITETVLRDGHQSLIATRMATEDMLPILEKMDRVGFFSLEMWGGATFDVCLRYLKEDPWQRLRQIRERVKSTKLQMLLRGQNLVGYRHYPDDIVVKFIQKSRDNGIDVFRIFDALNDIRNLELSIKTAKKTGAMVEGTISYTVSPIHTIAKFISFASELKDAGSDIICIKDMSGIITPTAAYDLINALKKEIKLPVHLHTHCTSGMAPMVYLLACEAGVDYLDTAISPFGWGTSQPPTESIVGALKGTPFDTGLNLDIIVEISEHFQKVREKYKSILDPISERVDPKILVHQTPGGMISNLISQLKEQNALDKYDEALKETALVRKDLGYPPLVTPTSQIVGTQAVFNVILGERYKMISNEVKDYIKGLYGRSPGLIDEELQKKAIGNETPITTRPAESIAPEWDKSLETVKALKQTDQPSDEDVLAYALFPLVAKEFWANPAVVAAPAPAVSPVEAKQPKEEVDSYSSKATLVLELNNKKYSVKVTPASSGSLKVDVEGRPYDVKVSYSGKSGLKKPAAEIKPEPAAVKSAQPIAPVQAATEGGMTNVTVPMPGKVVNIKVKISDKVKKGEVLFILEAMKMQNEICAPGDGIISEISIKVGDTVDNQTILMKIKG